MTMPDERSRALVWAGGFLIQLARDREAPIATRRRAVIIARHYPTIEQLDLMAFAGPSVELSYPHSAWAEQCPEGPLRDNTRLTWPEDDKGGIEAVVISRL